MRRLLLATGNPGKIKDFADAAGPLGYAVELLPGITERPAVEETGTTFAANARLKSEGYSRLAPGELVIADDSGLSVDALGGAPGVRSARFAADSLGHPPEGDANAANNSLLLEKLAGVPAERRSAHFICVISIARDGRELASFTGRVDGVITDVPRGAGGFGYDPLFLHPGAGKTFAELSGQQKARWSHRGKALAQLVEWLKTSQT